MLVYPTLLNIIESDSPNLGAVIKEQGGSESFYHPNLNMLLEHLRVKTLPVSGTNISLELHPPDNLRADNYGRLKILGGSLQDIPTTTLEQLDNVDSLAKYNLIQSYVIKYVSVLNDYDIHAITVDYLDEVCSDLTTRLEKCHTNKFNSCTPYYVKICMESEPLRSGAIAYVTKNHTIVGMCFRIKGEPQPVLTTNPVKFINEVFSERNTSLICNNDYVYIDEYNNIQSGSGYSLPTISLDVLSQSYAVSTFSESLVNGSSEVFDINQISSAKKLINNKFNKPKKSHNKGEIKMSNTQQRGN